MKFVQTKQFRIIPKPAYVVRAIINSDVMKDLRINREDLS